MQIIHTQNIRKNENYDCYQHLQSVCHDTDVCYNQGFFCRRLQRKKGVKGGNESAHEAGAQAKPPLKRSTKQAF